MNDGQRVLYYFAYGSNLHPVRLGERVPSANLLGVSELGKYRLVFHKKGQDGSSKCNLVQTGGECDQVYGAIYQLEQKHKNALDRIEGKGYGYRDQQIMMQDQGQEYNCFTYFAQRSHIAEKLKPYHWYKQLVVLGPRYLHFPNSYVIAIESIVASRPRTYLFSPNSRPCFMMSYISTTIAEAIIRLVSKAENPSAIILS